jgi:hypothetical protein
VNVAWCALIGVFAWVAIAMAAMRLEDAVKSWAAKRALPDLPVARIVR